MDKASAYGAGDCRFESCRGRKRECWRIQNKNPTGTLPSNRLGFAEGRLLRELALTVVQALCDYYLAPSSRGEARQCLAPPTSSLSALHLRSWQLYSLHRVLWLSRCYRRSFAAGVQVGLKAANGLQLCLDGHHTYLTVDARFALAPSRSLNVSER